MVFYIKLLVEIFDKNEWIIVWSFIFSDLVTIKLLGLNWHIHRVPYKDSWKKTKNASDADKKMLNGLMVFKIVIQLFWNM